MKTILYIIVTIFIGQHILSAQAHQEIDGSSQSQDPVLKVNVKYQGVSDVIAIDAQSFPTMGGSWGIGGRFKGGFYGVFGEAINDNGSGIGVLGVSSNGMGLRGNSSTGIGVFGSSIDSFAISGVSLNGMGLRGFSTYAEGVYGESDSGNGVFAKSKSGFGLVAESESASGVSAKSNSGLGIFSFSNTNISIRAHSQTSTGLSASTTSGSEAIFAEAFGDGSTGVVAKADSIGTYSEADGINSVGVYAKGNLYGIRATGFTAGLFEGSIDVKGGASLTGGVFSGGDGEFVGQVKITQVNKTNPAYSSHNGLRLDHHSQVQWWTMYIDESNRDLNFEDTGILRAYIDNGNGNFSIASDRRLKEEIVPLGPVLPEVMQLQPSTYYYKSDPTKDVKSLGFIAQEVETIFPDLVKEKNGIKTLAYDNFAILSIKAIQEQQAQIASLESEVKTLKELIERVLVAEK